jgi:hypothetical protein
MPREDKPDPSYAFFVPGALKDGECQRNTNHNTMLHRLRLLCILMAMTVLSAHAAVPEGIPLLLDKANGPQMPASGEWTTDSSDRTIYTVKIPDLTSIANPGLWINNMTCEYSYDGINYADISYFPTSGVSIGSYGNVRLLPHTVGYLRFRRYYDQDYHAMIFDQPVGEENTKEKIDPKSEAILGTIERRTFNLIQDGDSYTGIIRHTFTKSVRIVDLGYYAKYVSDITARSIDADGNLTPLPLVGDLEQGYCYLPPGSMGIELNIRTNTTSSIQYASVKGLLYQLSSTNASGPWDPYLTIIDRDQRYVSRESFYDLNGDGIFSATNANPIMTTIYPDGNIYSLTNSGNRLTRYDATGKQVLIEDNDYSRSLVPADYDLDGKYDFMYGSDVYTIGKDGNPRLDALRLLTPEQYEGVRSELKLSTGGEGIPGMGDMFGRDGGGIATEGTGTFADFNADGLTDVLVKKDNSTNTLYLNTGADRTYIYTSAPSVKLARDFDGDGLIDMVTVEDDGLKIYLQRRGQPSEAVMAYRGFSGSVLGACDVDGDGDVDLVVYASSRNGSDYDYYIAVIENLGNSKFTKHEKYLTNNIDLISGYLPQFSGIVDVDADGKYEILFAKDHKLCSVKLKSATEFGEIIEITQANSNYYESLGTVVPIANDGRMSYIRDMEPNIIHWATDPSWGVNSRPSRPVAPELSFDPLTGRLSVRWPAGSDAETPTADLTYELRVGTSEGAADIVAANALADGTRRIFADGANGYAREKVYDTSTWPQGRIYVSYQVVDACWRGSEFSPSATFENTRPPVAIAMEALLHGAGKPFEAWVEDGPIQGITYTWSCSEGGTVSIVDEATQRVSLNFGTPGTKTVTLTATDAAGNSASATRKVEVNPQGILIHESGIAFYNAIDLDGDGILELNNYGGFHIQKPDGTFEKYRRMFNSKAYSGITFDYDRDGLADIIGSNDVLRNLGDGDMEALVGVTKGTWTLDLNNDGYADTDNAINSGDYTTVTSIGRKVGTLTYDYNGDGLTDYFEAKWDYDARRYHILYHENIDGYRFADPVEIMSSDVRLQYVGDIDGDGTADMLFSAASYAFGVTSYDEYLRIYWGDGSAPTMVQCPDGEPFGSINSVADLNNDGVLDMLVSIENNYTIPVYLYVDHSYATHAERERTDDTPFTSITGNMRSYKSEYLLAAPNQRPTPPTGLRASQSSRGVVIEWNAGSDAETRATGLRYNISVKRRGAEGENAYIISPLNGGNEDMPLPQPIRLLNSTRFTIPIASIPAGEYEIKLQSVDTHMAASKFSETLLFTVEESALMEIPTTVMLDKVIAVDVRTNFVGEIDFGEGAVASSHTGGGRYNVVWHTEGLKKITAGGKQVATTMVIAAPDASFSIPASVFAGASVLVADGAEGTWEVSYAGGEWKPIGQFKDVISRIEGSDIYLTFGKTGSYTLRRTITRSQGDGTAERALTVTDGGEPAIARVACGDNMRYSVHWDASQIPAEVASVRIYRETESFGVFTLAAEVAPQTGAYTDLLSNGAVMPSRYEISWRLPYGETMHSEAHQPIHVQVNKALGDGINLMWSLYQGATVQSYRILRGTSPDHMSVIATVSGNISSYTDLQPGGVVYYAVETVMAAPQQARGAARSAESAARSNVVCSADARDAILAGSIAIISPSGSNLLFMADKRNMLTAAMMPAGTTINRANWEIVAGSENATIDAYGRLTYLQPGIISVKATACDGSGVSCTQDFEIRYSEVMATSIEFETGNMHTMQVGEQLRIGYTVYPAGTYQGLEWSAPYASPTEQVLTVTPDGLITAIAPGSELVRASCVDGSGFFDSVNITVVPNSGVEESVVSPSAMQLRVSGGELIVSSVRPGAEIRVYALDGTLIAYAASDGGETRFRLEHGFYIVTADGTSAKIRL